MRRPHKLHLSGIYNMRGWAADSSDGPENVELSRLVVLSLSGESLKRVNDRMCREVLLY